jgi:hypothetical protein
MAWITITEAMAQAALSGTEQTALAALNAKEGKADPVPAIITSVTREARSAVAAFASNSVGPTGMIPDEMQQAALSRIRYEILLQLPFGNLLTPQRIEANKDAIGFFDKIATGKRRIEQPVTAGPDVIPPSCFISKVSNRPAVRGHDLRGL